ncbi:uncharacterized protein LOC132559257 [Ylistrum balloti]|uniref:uncharacterized protein LOC132559257 n=1 Tax=Ylistrum balloti TaxID=509963 RepID=UPI00290583D6|nr:uncharacterized protein LOC132559257 [Ylistrum balloti]
MTSFFPTMRMKTGLCEEEDDMFNIHGHVGNHSRSSILESLRKIIKSRTEDKTKEVVTIGDFGTADGRASLCLINDMIYTIKAGLGEKQAIVLCYNDQPMNDFNRLIEVIRGNGQKSGLALGSDIYPVIIPRCMYGVCLPYNSMDLAISSVATHYLSKQVCQIKNGISLGEADEGEQLLIREQAKADWRTFVISRGRELKPGGYLVTMNVSSDEHDDEARFVEKGTTCVASFVTDMAKDGVITQEEYRATNFNSHYLRKAADFQEPFNSDLPEIKELGLELVSMKPIKHYLQYPTFDIVNKDYVEKMDYSQRIVSSIYPWMYHVLHGGLSESRTEEEKQAVIDNYFDRLREYVLAHSDHKPYVIHTEVVIKKKKTA